MDKALVADILPKVSLMEVVAAFEARASLAGGLDRIGVGGGEGLSRVWTVVVADVLPSVCIQ